MQASVSSSALIEDLLNCVTPSHAYCCLIDGVRFPEHSFFQDASPVKTDALGSKTTSKPLLSKGSFCIGSDNVWFATERDPEI